MKCERRINMVCCVVYVKLCLSFHVVSFLLNDVILGDVKTLLQPKENSHFFFEKMKK